VVALIVTFILIIGVRLVQIIMMSISLVILVAIVIPIIIIISTAVDITLVVEHFISPTVNTVFEIASFPVKPATIIFANIVFKMNGVPIYNNVALNIPIGRFTVATKRNPHMQAKSAGSQIQFIARVIIIASFTISAISSVMTAPITFRNTVNVATKRSSHMVTKGADT